MIIYAPLQRKWLRHHFEKWSREYGWSAAEFAKRVKQPPAALAEVLGISVEEFGPPDNLHNNVMEVISEPVAPAPPPELPEPGSETVIIEPGVELMPREKPATPAPPVPPSPPPTMGQVLLRAGHHVIDDMPVEIPGHHGESVWYPLAFGRHTVDNKLVHIAPPTVGFRIHL